MRIGRERKNTPHRRYLSHGIMSFFLLRDYCAFRCFLCAFLVCFQFRLQRYENYFIYANFTGLFYVICPIFGNLTSICIFFALHFLHFPGLHRSILGQISVQSRVIVDTSIHHSILSCRFVAFLFFVRETLTL